MKDCTGVGKMCGKSRKNPGGGGVVTVVGGLRRIEELSGQSLERLSPKPDRITKSTLVENTHFHGDYNCGTLSTSPQKV